jgi:hypothetical protein
MTCNAASNCRSELAAFLRVYAKKKTVCGGQIDWPCYVPLLAPCLHAGHDVWDFSQNNQSPLLFLDTARQNHLSLQFGHLTDRQAARNDTNPIRTPEIFIYAGCDMENRLAR